MDSTQLKDLLSKKDYSRRDKILLCLSTENYEPRSVKEIRALAVSSGLRAAAKWNISQILKEAPELVIRTDSGWELTSDGRHLVFQIAGPSANSAIPRIASNLRQHIPSIAEPDTQRFLEEAVECYEARLHRAAIVLSWVGAISVLQQHVIANHMAAFNAEAISRNPKWKTAKTADDLSQMKESEFLVVLEKLSVIGKNVKRELENCLALRNGCGHPNSLQLGEARVSAHLEMLILNVFSVF